MTYAPSRTSFERVLLVAVLIEIVYLIGLFERRMEVDGLVLALAFTFVVPLVFPMLGFLVTRRKSAIAKWVLIFLVALTWLAGARAGIAGWTKNPVLLLGAAATFLETVAVLMLFTREGRSWTSRRDDFSVSAPVNNTPKG